MDVFDQSHNDPYYRGLNTLCDNNSGSIGVFAVATEWSMLLQGNIIYTMLILLPKVYLAVWEESFLSFSYVYWNSRYVEHLYNVFYVCIHFNPLDWSSHKKSCCLNTHVVAVELF